MSDLISKKIKFLERCKIQDAEGKVFEEGEIVELPLASAERWIRRNLAVEVTEEEKKTSGKKSSKKQKGEK